MKKKVLYLLDYPLDLLGGAQLSTKTICDYMTTTDSKYEPCVVCPKLIGRNYYPYRVYEFDNSKYKGKLSSFFGYIRVYKKVMQELKPEIVHAQMPMAAIFFGIARRIGFFRSCKFIYTDRSCYDGYAQRSRFVFKGIFNVIDNLICTTNYNKRLWQEDYHDAGKIKVIYNCVTPEFGDAVSDVKTGNTETVTIGFAGRMTDIKNWPLCELLCGELLKMSSDCRIKIVLSAYGEEMESMGSQFGEKIKNMDSDRVDVFFELNQSEMAAFYGSLDIFILTSKFESFGKTAIEAMACYCVVLGTAVGGIPEVIGKDANIYHITDYAKCVNRVFEYINNRQLLSDDKEWFRKRYLTFYSVDRNCDEYIKLYCGEL